MVRLNVYWLNFFVVFFVFIMVGFFVHIFPLDNKISRQKYLYGLYEDEINFLKNIPEESRVLANEIQEARTINNFTEQGLTVDKLADFLQQHNLQRINVQPEGSKDGDLIFLIRCSGRFQDLMRFLNELLNSKYLVSLVNLELSSEGFSISLAEV